MSLLVVSPVAKYLAILLGSNVIAAIITLVLAKILGKKKEEVEYAIKYQEFYTKLIKDQDKIILDLTTEVKELKDLVEKSIEGNKIKDGIILKQGKEIKQNDITIKKWENENANLKQTIAGKISIISSQLTEIEENEEVISKQSRDLLSKDKELYKLKNKLKLKNRP